MRGFLESPIRWASMVLVLLLASCGGGGAGGPTPVADQPASALQPSRLLANVCTLEGEKKFVRSYLDEKYLWYKEIPQVDASQYSTTTSYFKSLLVKTPDVNGLPKDQFSFVIPTADADSLSTGVNVGYGVEWVRDAQNRLRVAQIMPGSPAADAGMARGGHMVEVLNYYVNSWYPNTTGAFIQFNYSDTPGAPLRTIYLTARTVQDETVPLASTVSSPGGLRAGYIAFSSHSEGAQDKLISAVHAVQASGVRELVLDMRYNSGGYLYIANALASMVAGPQAEGKIFEALRYNDKRAAETAGSAYLFANRVQFSESQYPAGYPLPQLNLKRVYVLTSQDTCSASESVINSLRGIDVDVVLIGKSTCGKPYGFTRKNNCALSYYPIEFQGTNDKGFGDYSAGFAPTCQGSDDLDHALGRSQEGLLSSALYHMDHGSCQPIPAQKQIVANKAPADSSQVSTARMQRGRQLRSTSP